MFPLFSKRRSFCYFETCRVLLGNDLPGVQTSVGIAGKFDFIVDPDIVSSIMNDNIPGTPREGLFYKSSLDRRGVGLLTGTGVLLSSIQNILGILTPSTLLGF